MGEVEWGWVGVGKADPSVGQFEEVEESGCGYFTEQVHRIAWGLPSIRGQMAPCPAVSSSCPQPA